MKALLLTFMTTTLLVSTAFADESVFTSSDAAKLIEEARLLDGRKIEFKRDVERLHLFDNKIDYFELKNGEIVDRSDIFSIKRPDSYGLIFKATGVDGGG